MKFTKNITKKGKLNPSEKFYFKCKSFVPSGHPQWVHDDFPAWATVKYLEGRRSSINYLLIDYMRQFTGKRSGCEKQYEKRQNMHIRTLPASEDFFDSGLGVGEHSTKQVDAIVETKTLMDAASRLEQTDRAIFF